ncbi:arabinan endo-1,5-alpha-L-arabinosidase [Prevotella herbatica]|uniref:Arabinan endo-1,5-alpha-L-arabinosidase n=1 Tax=Prevotella herbatica TaxID=2801997 RepID=A0ABN6EFC1_9BACT|nr:arabinan endo-1,5-alpha-L-arabinosidase [Prevotella herbatica]BCS84556.1 arabinan endo-1,5-alpha-L-arabinosidase [Prevotella herbatica]
MKYLNIILLSLSSLCAIGCSGGDTSEGVKPTPTTPTGVDEQLANYVAPTYNDDYTSIASWDNRSKWNLANVHDPSVMKADDGYYYMYQTDASYGNAHIGHGHFFCRRSKNLVDWEFMGATMSSLPSWVKTKLNEIRSNMGLSASTVNFNDETQFGFWAPCARRVSANLYRMYYVITVPGTINGDNTWSERAFIGMMETATPSNISSWVDKGYVITNASDKGLNFNVKSNDWANCYFKYNAIDPSYIITQSGEHWLVYGSWHSGFAAVQLNSSTGLPLNALGNPWGTDISAYGKLINTRQMGNRWQASEAPEVVYHDGYYYMFMAYDELSVAYNTRVVRSKNIDGPYVGIDGTDVTNNGGDAYPIVTHPYKFSKGYGWVGISHCAVFDDGNGNWFFSSQGRFPANVGGNAYSNAIMMGQVRSIRWTEDGWPVVMPERYGAVPQAAITESELVGNWEHIDLSYNYAKQDVATTMTLAANHTVTAGTWTGATWSYDATTKVLTVNGVKLYLQREVDWEASPRKATIVYAGYNGKKTYWGKKVN